MKNFHIEYPDESFREALIDKNTTNLNKRPKRLHWVFWKILHCKSD